MKRYSESIIAFKLVPLTAVPSHDPIAKNPANLRGSQWDEVLRALEAEKGRKAARIDNPDKRTRIKLKSTLQTMAKNRHLIVTVRDDNRSAMYAWIEGSSGRFASPFAIVSAPRKASTIRNFIADHVTSYAVELNGVPISLTKLRHPG
jgi:hypothetical protein